MKSVLCIGGFDPSGGAGLAADLKTLSAIGVHGYSIVTTVTAQNSHEFLGHTATTVESLRLQWQAVFNETTPDAIKIGLIPNEEIFTEIFELLKTVNVPVVYDPVLATSTGFQLPIQPELVLSRLTQIAVLTPNLPEFNSLGGPHPTSTTHILLKGGHHCDPDFTTDVLYSCVTLSSSEKKSEKNQDTDYFELTLPRHPENFRGTGCSLSSALAGFYVLNKDNPDEVHLWREAFVQAKQFVFQSFREAPYLNYANPIDTATSTDSSKKLLPWTGKRWPASPTCGEKPLGFYPVVDRAHWLEKLLPLGTSTIQLRVKDLDGYDLEQEVVKAIKVAELFNARLFINDYWQLAIRHKAYGIHLGQEDLQALSQADIQKIKDSGLRVGLSTHSFEELVRAHSFNPSYIALGPVFPTTAKKMKFGPQSLERVTRWKSLSPCPLVAIGGMNLERGKEAYIAGADSVAMMSDITAHPHPTQRAKQWLQLDEEIFSSRKSATTNNCNGGTEKNAKSLATKSLATLSTERYQHHLRLAEIGQDGQKKIADAKVLIIGAGGLGGPASLYLAAAGIGTLGIVDSDQVELSNLQRQILFNESDVHRSKAEQAGKRLRQLNSEIDIKTYPVRLTSENFQTITTEYDIIIDGSDNFSTKYLLSDICVAQRKPFVFAAIEGFSSLLGTFLPGQGCYRCVFPEPPSSAKKTCSEFGVVGALPGVIGAMQALEAIKLICGMNVSPLLHRFQFKNWQKQSFKIGKDSLCPACSPNASSLDLIKNQSQSAITGCRWITSAQALKFHTPPLWIDIRSREEFSQNHIKGAKNLPLEEFSIEQFERLPAHAIIYCQSGRRCENVWTQVKDYPQFLFLKGGLNQAATIPMS